MTAPTASEPVVVDSSGWLEYITADTKAALFAPYFESARSILVPVIVLYEVRKILLLRSSKTLADIFVSEALRRTIVPIDEQVALSAAALSVQYQLAMADALLYATARTQDAQFITSDAHFRNLPHVKMI
ncbi:MAG TPA: type II toxin-antitoxin system VapC family toxin [Candidatus Acidoferrum sp.]